MTTRVWAAATLIIGRKSYDRAELTKQLAATTIYDDDAAYIGINGGCHDGNFNRAVLTNHNYAWFATSLIKPPRFSKAPSP